MAPTPRYSAGYGRSVAQPGRALSSGGRGRRFESSHSDQNSLNSISYTDFHARISPDWAESGPRFPVMARAGSGFIACDFDTAGRSNLSLGGIVRAITVRVQFARQPSRLYSTTDRLHPSSCILQYCPVIRFVISPGSPEPICLPSILVTGMIPPAVDVTKTSSELIS